MEAASPRGEPKGQPKRAGSAHRVYGSDTYAAAFAWTAVLTLRGLTLRGVAD
mgnify:CR=1